MTLLTRHWGILFHSSKSDLQVPDNQQRHWPTVMQMQRIIRIFPRRDRSDLSQVCTLLTSYDALFPFQTSAQVELYEIWHYPAIQYKNCQWLQRKIWHGIWVSFGPSLNILVCITVGRQTVIPDNIKVRSPFMFIPPVLSIYFIHTVISLLETWGYIECFFSSIPEHVMCPPSG